MKLNCCGNFYYSNGYNFEKVSRYTTSPKKRIKHYSQGERVLSETIYVSVCENCGHYIVSVIRKLSNLKVEKETYRGNQADEYFYSNYNKFEEMPLPCPFADIKHSATIPFIYGKTIDKETQIPRYIDESSNAGNFIESFIKIYNND